MKNQISTNLCGINARRRWRGSAVLDAALVFPILLSLTFGTVEYGYYFYVKHTLQGAAREGARAAITPGSTNTTMTAAVTNAMTAAGLQNSGYTTTPLPSDVSTVATGQPVKVTVSCTWGTVGAGFRPLGLIGTNKTVSG